MPISKRFSSVRIYCNARHLFAAIFSVTKEMITGINTDDSQRILICTHTDSSVQCMAFEYLRLLHVAVKLTSLMKKKKEKKKTAATKQIVCRKPHNWI